MHVGGCRKWLPHKLISSLNHFLFHSALAFFTRRRLRSIPLSKGSSLNQHLQHVKLFFFFYKIISLLFLYRRFITSIRGELVPYLVRKQFSKAASSKTIEDDTEDQKNQIRSDGSTNQGQCLYGHTPTSHMKNQRKDHSYCSVASLKQHFISFISIRMENA